MHQVLGRGQVALAGLQAYAGEAKNPSAGGPTPWCASSLRPHLANAHARETYERGRTLLRTG
ncbi:MULTISPECIES: hypothetical protein [Streptomyces]|uniref:hypothetical protein n=1 Tax=Streptomyces TaxID=1883 RepID=UPI000F6F0B9B|nr:hypothetical protein [Streptomyces sp. W1SF4]AZM90749.1 hypothetical protein D1J60_21725 [Streptomyces sp. W1SF4]